MRPHARSYFRPSHPCPARARARNRFRVGKPENHPAENSATYMSRLAYAVDLPIKSKAMNPTLNKNALLAVAINEARAGLAEGGVPIGAALFDGEGNLLGRGHNRRVQENDPSI